MKPPEDTIATAARSVAKRLQHLAAGPLADLRRMPIDTAAPEFWRLAARHPSTIGNPSRYREWIAIVRILAILTEKGDPGGRRRLHDPKRPLGVVLCDGGERDWPSNDGGVPRPAFSERRLAQLMAARGPQRAMMLERAARALARSRDPGSGVDVVDVAYTLLAPEHRRRLAEPYYRRLDRAERDAEKSEQGTE
ncbi:MAG: type I-E CRISPR-associated protein Cse2/CasB [bacterium]|nr:type I-E CRISPR-associated protein Cse2/CasB [bacterium]